MRLLRYGPPGREKPGLADKDGNIRDLSKLVAQIDDAMLSPRNLARLARVKPETLPIVRGSPHLGVPYAGISKFVAIGLNYRDHAEEAGLPIPAEPVVFMKASTCLCGPNDDTIMPKNSQKLDYEVELGVVIGTKAQHVSESKALDYVAGYTVVNDVSERHFQMGPGGQWDRGKGCDTFGPVGPWLVTTDEITDPHVLDMWLDVNGEKRQRGNTRTMIYNVPTLVSYVSQFMTLLPGDIITTGTPPGVALGMKPTPGWLKVGDVVTLGIQGLGEQRQKILAFPGEIVQRVSKQRLEAWAVACLEKVGVPPPEARLVADSLVQTSVWGVDSHGVLRLTHYLRRMTMGSIKAASTPVVMRTGPVTAQVHGEDGLGIVHAALGMETAIEMAKECGVGVVGVGHSSHCGAMGLYTRMAAREHLVGIAMTHSSSVVVPHGGKRKYFGTNPISFAFPRASGEAVCLDMATSQVAWNKVLNARIEGKPLDPGIAVDAAGTPTTDADKAQAGIPLGGPIYGYKGYGLAFAVDLLCGVMNGMTFGRHINSMYEDLDRPRKIGHLLMALDPARFAGGESMESTIDALIADLRGEGDEVMYPGEPEERAMAERLAQGIPIDAEALKDMHDWSAKLGVPPPTDKAPT